MKKILEFKPKISFSRGISILLKKKMKEKKDQKIKLSIIVPVYNESDRLEQVIKEFVETIEKRFNLKFEILLCENGSTDETLQIAKKLAKSNSKIKVFILPAPNYGKSLKIGFLNARGKYLVNFAVDWYSFDFLEKALQLIKNCDIVAGSKLIGNSDKRDIKRRVITRVYVAITKIALGIKTTDTHAFKLFDNKKIRPIVGKTFSDKAIFDTELILRAEKAGFKIVELPARIVERRKTKLKMGRAIYQSFIDIIKLRTQLKKERVI